MPDVANLVIKADSTDIKKADKSLQHLNKTSDKTEKQTKKTNKGFASMSSTLKTMAPLVAAAAASYAGMQMVRVARETEMYIARLKTMTGSMEAANIAFDQLNEFARQTPFNLNQSIDAFVKLKALGLDPSEEAMLSYGNTAAAMGKSLTQMIEAVADASTNEFERLKEFGIKAKQQGDQVTFTFQGVSTTVKKSSEEIQGYLMDIGQTQFAGAMEDQMNTIDGQLSNLGMSFDDLWRTMGEGLGVSEGIKSALESVSNVIISLTNELTELFRAIEVNKYTDLIEEQENLNKSVEMYNKLISDGLAVNDGYTQGIEIQKTRLAEVNKQLESLGISLGFVKAKEIEVAETTDKTTETVKKLGTATKTTTSQISDFEKALNSIRELDIQDVLFDINEAVDAGVISWREYYELMEQYGQTAAQSLDIVSEKIKGTDEEEGGLIDWANTAETAINGLSGAFIDMALDGKNSFADFAQSFLTNIAKMIAQQAILNGMKSVFPSLFAANGAAFDSGNVVPMASGGLITQPTLFPMANGGTAIAGEAGNEVIMPIGRASNGDMGVIAKGAGGGTVVNINNYTSSTATARKSTDSNGVETIDIMIEEKVNAAIKNGGLDKQMNSVYGNRRVGY